MERFEKKKRKFFYLIITELKQYIKLTSDKRVKCRTGSVGMRVDTLDHVTTCVVMF